jgi:pimeloyl-ACP methyl ester carboxylesterase
MPVRLNLAFFDVNAADRAIAAFPEVKHWIVGGHSLGGVAAATYAARKDNVDGVVFWAAYPGDETLKKTDLKIMSIYGTLDMSGAERFKSSRDDLPADAEFVVIEGGNHSQFGHYGLQPGDHPATITPFEQQRQAARATVQFLKEITQ